MKRPMGNGAGKVVLVWTDMGGWVRIHTAENSHLPHDIGVYLSSYLAEFFRTQPDKHMRCVVPIQKDGDTVELHAWYEQHIFPAKSGPQPEKPKEKKEE